MSKRHKTAPEVQRSPIVPPDSGGHYAEFHINKTDQFFSIFESVKDSITDLTLIIKKKGISITEFYGNSSSILFQATFPAENFIAYEITQQYMVCVRTNVFVAAMSGTGGSAELRFRIEGTDPESMTVTEVVADGGMKSVIRFITSDYESSSIPKQVYASHVNIKTNYMVNKLKKLKSINTAESSSADDEFKIFFRAPDHLEFSVKNHLCDSTIKVLPSEAFVSTATTDSIPLSSNGGSGIEETPVQGYTFKGKYLIKYFHNIFKRLTSSLAYAQMYFPAPDQQYGEFLLIEFSFPELGRIRWYIYSMLDEED